MAARSCRGCGAAARGLARLTDGLASGRPRGAVVVNGRATPLPRSLPPRRAVRLAAPCVGRCGFPPPWTGPRARPGAPPGAAWSVGRTLSRHPGTGNRKARTSPPASCLKVGVLDYWRACGRASVARSRRASPRGQARAPGRPYLGLQSPPAPSRPPDLPAPRSCLAQCERTPPGN